MKTKIAVLSAIVYLVVLTLLANIGTAPALCAFMYLCSPLVVVLMVFTVLKEKNYDYPELAAGEEWSYRDKSKREFSS